MSAQKEFLNSEGQKVPSVTFPIFENNAWKQVSSDDLFTGKTVILFSLPGAYTPTCSSAHLPRYNQLAPLFKEHGVDDIVCMSVNDTFVMTAWSEAQNAENIHFIPDGNGDFSQKMSLLVDKTAIGFGKRSWRYSMLVKDGHIEKMFIEANVAGDPFEVSDADTMLQYLAPESKIPANVSIFTRKGCSFCAKAKSDLKAAGYRYEELVLNEDYTDLTLRAIAESSKVPQIFIDGKHIGGSIELDIFLSLLSPELE